MKKKHKDFVHSIALKHRLPDSLVQIVVETPFLFQKRKLEEGIEEDGGTFYHIHLGKFYIDREFFKKLKKIKKEKDGE